MSANFFLLASSLSLSLSLDSAQPFFYSNVCGEGVVGDNAQHDHRSAAVVTLHESVAVVVTWRQQPRPPATGHSLRHTGTRSTQTLSTVRFPILSPCLGPFVVDWAQSTN